jgi:putative NADH-flavin reductase
MNIAIIGATGFVGGFITTEALTRGHTVTGLVRHPEKLPGRANLKGVKADVMNEKETAAALQGHDAVISSFNPGWDNPDLYTLYIKGTRSIIDAVKASGIKRLLIVGGAGSLEIKPGVQLVDTPEFPGEYKQGALAARDMLDIIKQEEALEWTFISPSAILVPGERTCRFRYGTDQLITDKKGDSRISTQDLAVAILDEIENPRYIKRRFTAGY